MKRIQRLNPKWTFDTFVVGPSNRIAHTVALAVAQAPGKAYNPLCIYGGQGLGKTHLMQAIGHYVLIHSKAKIQYSSCDALVDEYVHSFRNRHVKRLRDKYCGADLLLIDDIHYLDRACAAHKDFSLQDEIINIFNTLYAAHKQIIMTSDRPGSEMVFLKTRLGILIQWDMETDIMPPEFKTRLAILHLKQKMMKISLDKDVLNYMANHITSSIRCLEGALHRLAAYASVYEKTITPDLARSVLGYMVEGQKEE